jgi:hypothetical protein
LPQPVDHRLLWLVLVLVGALLLLFVNRAFHIDDPLFLWAAKQIQTHQPIRAVSGELVRSDMAMFDVTKTRRSRHFWRWSPRLSVGASVRSTWP